MSQGCTYRPVQLLGSTSLYLNDQLVAIIAAKDDGTGPEVMDNRKAVYEAARSENPRRWSRWIRDWELAERVWLNPEKDRADLVVAA